MRQIGRKQRPGNDIGRTNKELRRRLKYAKRSGSDWRQRPVDVSGKNNGGYWMRSEDERRRLGGERRWKASGKQ